MTHEHGAEGSGGSGGFHREFWDRHWDHRPGGTPAMAGGPSHPYLARELAGLAPGTALDAGCGAGAEALWLAGAGWRVTAVDIAAAALARAAERAAAAGVGPERVTWVQADLGTWEPDTAFDLVTTHYAHPAMPQLDFYARVAGWVAPGGTLLVVGHLGGHGHENGHRHESGHGHESLHEQDAPPAHATTTAAAVAARLPAPAWEVVTAQETRRTVRAGERTVTLDDVVVRAVRR